MAARIPARLSARDGRRFGVELGAAFAVLGGLLAWRGHAVSGAVSGALGAVLLGAALVRPAGLAPVRRAWMALGAGLSRITTPVTLALMYFAVITPVAFARRLLGRNPLAHERGKPTYWVSRRRPQSDIEHQF